MAGKSHNPDDRAGWGELGDILRPAIAQVRATPPPQEAVDRALARARRLGGRAPRNSLPPRALYIASALAASLLLGVGLHYGSPFAGQPPARPAIPRTRHTPDTAQAPVGPVVVRPRLPGADGDDTLHPAGLGQIGSSWGDWERLRGLRSLAADLPAVESYISHPVASRAPSQPLVWTNQPRTPAVARITDSDGRSLQLQGVYVQARLQGARARTVVELVFYNPHELAVDGRLECALPDGASPSWLTLFRGGTGLAPRGPQARPPARPPLALPAPAQIVARVSEECWGKPRTAAVVPADVPLAPARQHPALAARDDRPLGNVFGGELGPIAGKKHIRLVLAYEQTLPLADGRLSYTYTAPAGLLYQLSFKLQMEEALGRRAEIVPAEIGRAADEGLVTYSHSWRNAEGVEVLFRAEPPSQSVQSACGQVGDEGPYYLHARLRPGISVPAKPTPYARHAVFLLDATAAEGGARFARRVKLLQQALAADDAIEHFNVLLCTTSPGWLDSKRWLPNTAKGRAEAVARLEGLVLEGAADLGTAFARLAAPTFAAPRGTPVHAFFLCDGRATWGETGAARLAATAHARARWALRWHCFPSGARDEDAELYAALARHGGGTYRLAADADLAAAAAAHRQPALAVREVRFVGGPAPLDVVTDGGKPLVYPGGDLVVAARFDRPGVTRVEVIGDLNGSKVVQQFPVEISDLGPLGPRGWGEVAVRELEATRGPEAEQMAERIARSLGIAGRTTRFAFLAEDVPPAVRPLPADAPVDRRVTAGWQAASRPRSAADRRAALQASTERWLGSTAPRQQLLEVLALVKDAELAPPARPPAAPRADLPPRSTGGPPDYLSALKGSREQVGAWLDEAARRAAARDSNGAVRCLSGLLCEHPDRGDLARVVSGRLLAMGRAADAVAVMQKEVERDGLDPANHRALALALGGAGRRGLAVFHAEAAHALLGGQGGWYAAAREDLAALLRLAAGDSCLPRELRDHCRSRLEEIGAPPSAAVTVTLTWCTPAARLELAVVEPGGKRTKAEMSPDRRGLAGPLRAQLARAPTGPLAIEATYRDGDERTIPEVAATIEVIRHAGTPRQTIQRYPVVLRRPGDTWRAPAQVVVAGQSK